MMNSSAFKRQRLARVIALVVASACAASASIGVAAGTTPSRSNLAPRAQKFLHTHVSDARMTLSQAPANYIVVFDEPALAQYDVSNARLASKALAMPRIAGKRGRNKLDVRSTQAKNYLAAITSAQQTHLGAIQQTLGAAIVPSRTLRYALNAMVVSLTASQAQQVVNVPGVSRVVRDATIPLASDIGPGFIGASNLWWGRTAPQETIFLNDFDTATGFRGDGIVIGVIDTGYNSASPSFSATDASGYTIANPLGHGNYLGQCSLPMISVAGCNDKVIGVYDMIHNAPPYSVEDTTGHGSATASIAAGNSRSAEYYGAVTQISGIAPHANFVIFTACTFLGCSQSVIAASVDQAIQDGVVDALNFSISGGTDPWGGEIEQALLSAENAGIFVAAAAGNGDPEPGSVNHWEPWTTTVGASTHTGTDFGLKLSMTGPGSVSTNVTHIPLYEGYPDEPLQSALVPTTPVVLSPNFHNHDINGTDGCSAYPTGTFSNAIALISRGTCEFYDKVINAINAGAVAVLISDNRVEVSVFPTLVSPAGSPAISVPVWMVRQGDGTALQAFLAANGGVGTGEVPYVQSRLAQQPDVMAGFSLIGPGGIDVLKPDIIAPGVDILAASANDSSPSGPNEIQIGSGTSFATPHVTGAGALLIGLHPEWTPAEVKSALMMTAKEMGLTKPDGISPADNYDYGAGRIQVDIASKAELVMKETAQHYALANPATGGDPATLNLPSMGSADCRTGTEFTCSFTRTFASAASHSVHWTVAVSGDLAPRITLASAAFTSVPNGSNILQVTIDSSGDFGSSPHFAELSLTPDDGSPVLHLPIVASLPPPILSAPRAVSIALNGAVMATTSLTIENVGGATLNFAQNTAGSGTYVVAENTSSMGVSHSGYISTRYIDKPAASRYVSQPFTVTGGSSINLTTIGVYGFSADSVDFPSSTPLHVAIYADASGKPAGNPDDPGSPAPVWRFDKTIGDVHIAESHLVINPPDTTQLSAGTYWITIYTEQLCEPGATGYCTMGWVWDFSNTTSAPVANWIEPAATPPDNLWVPVPEGMGMTLRLESLQYCDNGNWWLTMLPNQGSISGGAIRDATLSATAGATTYLCIHSNTADHNDPALIQVNATP